MARRSQLVRQNVSPTPEVVRQPDVVPAVEARPPSVAMQGTLGNQVVQAALGGRGGRLETHVADTLVAGPRASQVPGAASNTAMNEALAGPAVAPVVPAVAAPTGPQPQKQLDVEAARLDANRFTGAAAPSTGSAPPPATPAAPAAGGSDKVADLEAKRSSKAGEIERIDLDLGWKEQDADRIRRSTGATQNTLDDVQGRLADRQQLIQERAAAAQAEQEEVPSPETDGPARHLRSRAEYLPKRIVTDRRRQEGIGRDEQELEAKRAISEEELAKIDEELAAARQAASKGGGGGGGGGGPPPRVNRPETSKRAAPLLRAQKGKYTNDLEVLKAAVQRLEKKEDKALKAQLDEAKKALDGVVAEIGDQTAKLGIAERAVASLEGKITAQWGVLNAAKQAVTDAEAAGKAAPVFSVSTAEIVLKRYETDCAAERTNVTTCKTNIEAAKAKKPKLEKAHQDLQARYDLTCKDLVAKREELKALETYGANFDADITELEKGSLVYADILAKYNKSPITVVPVNLKPGELEDVPGKDQEDTAAAEAAKNAEKDKPKDEKKDDPNKAADDFQSETEKAAAAKKKEADEKARADEANKTPAQKAEDAAKKVEDDKKKKAEAEQKVVEDYAKILAGDPTKKDAAIKALAEKTGKDPKQLAADHTTSTQAAATKLAGVQDIKGASPTDLSMKLGLPEAQIRAYQLELKRKEMEDRARRYFGGNTDQAMKQLWKSLDDRGMSTAVGAGSQLPADAMMDQLVHADQGKIPADLKALAGAAKAGARAEYDKMTPAERQRYDAGAEKRRTDANQVEQNHNDAVEIAKSVGLKDAKSAQSYIAGLQKSMGFTKPEDAIKYLKMNPTGGGKPADAALKEKIAKARMSTPEDKARLLTEIGKEYGPKALMGVAVQADAADPDGIVKGPVANDALQTQIAEIRKLPPEKRYDAMKELATLSNQDLNQVVVACENREKKDTVVGNYTAAATDPTLNREERQKKLEEIARARGLKLEELKVLMDKQRERTQKLLDEAAAINPKVRSLRDELAKPETLKDRAKLRADLARESGVSASLVDADDKQTEWQQKKEKWAKKFGKKDPDEAAEFVANHAKKYGIKPDEVEDHLRYSDDPALSEEAKNAKKGVSRWDRDPANMSEADKALREELKAADVDDPKKLQKVPTTRAELEELQKKDPAKADQLYADYCSYCDKRQRLIDKLDETHVNDKEALELLRVFTWAELAALLRENPVDEDKRPIMASFADGVGGDELTTGKKWFEQAKHYNAALDLYDPKKEGAIDAKKKWAQRIDESMHLKEDAATALGLPPAEAQAHIQAMSVAMGVSPREALDLLTGKPVLDSNGNPVKPATQGAGGQKTLPPAEMQKKLEELKALPKDQRLAALAELKGAYALDPKAMLAVVYYVPPGGNAADNPAFKAQIQSIDAMPPGPEKNAAMLRLSEAAGVNARQMVDALDTVKADNDAVAKMHAIRDLPEKDREAALAKLTTSSGKTKEQLDALYQRSLAEIEARVDPKIVARLKDTARNGTASPMSLKADIEELCAGTGMTPQQAQMLVERLRGDAFSANLRAKLPEGSDDQLRSGAFDKGMSPEEYATFLARTPESMLAGDSKALALKKALATAGIEPAWSPEELEAAKKAGIVASRFDPQYVALSAKLKDQLSDAHDDDEILKILKDMTPAMRALFAKDWKDMRDDREARGMSVPDTLRGTFEDALQGDDEDSALAILDEAEKYDEQAELKKQFAIVDTEAGPYVAKRDKLASEIMRGKDDDDPEVIKTALSNMTIAERAQFLRDMEALKNKLHEEALNGAVEEAVMPPDLAAFVDGDPDLARWLKDATAFMAADPTVQWREKARATQEMYRAAEKAKNELGLPDIRSARIRLEMVSKEWPGLSPENALNMITGRPVVDDRKKLSAFEQRFVNVAITSTNINRSERNEPVHRSVPLPYDPNRLDPKKLGAATANDSKVTSAHSQLTEYFAYEDPLLGKTDLGPHREQITQLVRDLNVAELAELDKKFGGKLGQLLNENVNNQFYGKSEITRKLADMRNFQDSAVEKPYREMMGELTSVDPSKDADPNTPEGLAQRMAFINSLPFELKIIEINKLQAVRRANGADPRTVMDAVLYGPKGQREGLPLGAALSGKIAEIQKLPWYEQEASMDALAALAHQDPKAFREAAAKTEKELKIATEYAKLADLPAAERTEKLEALAKENEVSVDDLAAMHWRLKEMGHFPAPKVTLDAEQRKRLQDVSKLPPGPERTEALRRMCADTGIQPRDLVGCINEELTAERKTRQDARSQTKEAESLIAKADKDDPDAMRTALVKYKDKPEELKKILDKMTANQRQKFDTALKDCFDGGFWKTEDNVGLLQMQEIVGGADRAKPEPILPPGASASDSDELQHLMRMDPENPKKQEQLDALKAKLNLTEGDWAKLQEHATWGYEAFEDKAKRRLDTLNAAMAETVPDDKRIREILADTSPDLLLAMERKSGGALSRTANESLGGALKADLALKLKVAADIETLPPEERKEKTTAIRVADKAERLTALFAAAKEGPGAWDAFVDGMAARDLTREQLLETLRDCTDDELAKLNAKFGGKLLAEIEAVHSDPGGMGIAGAMVGGLVPGLGIYAMSTRPDESDQRAILNRLKNATRKPGEPMVADEARVKLAFERLKGDFGDVWNDRAMIGALEGLNGAEVMALKAKFEADPELGGDFVAKMRADLDGDELAQFVALMDNARDEVSGKDLRTDQKSAAYDLVVREKIRELQRDPKNRARSDVELYDLATRDAAALDKAVEAKLGKVQESANALFKAIDGWGDDTNALLGTLSGLTPDETELVKVEYRRRFGKDLQTQMTSELSMPGFWDSTKESWLGDDAQTEKMDLQIALKMMSPETRVDGLRDYFGRMSFSQTAWTEDEDLIFSTLEKLSPEERTALVAGPAGTEFVELLKRDLGDVDRELVDAYTRIDPETGLAMANPAHVAAAKIKQAMFGSGEWWSFSGTDEDKLLAEMDKLTPAQLKEVERYYDQYLSGSGSTFRSDICDEIGLDSEEMKVIDAELRGDKVAADIHRLKYAADGWGTNEKLIEDTLKAGGEGRGGRSKDHLDRVKGGFNQLYGQTGGEYAGGTGSALDTMLDREFSAEGLSYGSEKAYFQQLADKGEADPEIELLYAMEGFGTDEARVQKIVVSYADKSPAERRLLALRFQEISPDGESLEDWLEGDFGGTELFNMKLQLRGTPQTPEEILEVARLRHDFERGGLNSLLNPFMDALEVMGAHSTSSLVAKEMSDVNTMFDLEGNFVGDPEVLAERTTWLKMDLENYRTVRDTVADTAATAVQVIGAAVCMVIPGLQGGAALIIANLVIALAATGVKLAIKGAGADWQEGAMDLATAAVSAFTAGVGDKFASLGKSIGGKFAAILSQAGKLKTFFEEVMAKMVESGVESFLNTLLTSEQAWQEGDWAFAKHMMKGTFGGMAKAVGVMGVGKALAGTSLGRQLEAIEAGDPVKKAGALEHLALKYGDNVIKAAAGQILTLDNWETWGDGKGNGFALFKTVFVDTAKDAALNVAAARSDGMRAYKQEKAQEAAQSAQQKLDAVRANPNASKDDVAAAEKAHAAAQQRLSALASNESASKQIAREDRESASQALGHHQKALDDAERAVAELGGKPDAELTDPERRRLALANEQLPALQAELPRLAASLRKAWDDEQAIAAVEADRQAALEARRERDAVRAEAALRRDADRPQAEAPPDPALDKAMTAHAIEVAHTLAKGAEVEGEVAPVEPEPVRPTVRTTPVVEAEEEEPPTLEPVTLRRVLADPEVRDQVRDEILDAGSHEAEQRHLDALVASLDDDPKAVTKAFPGDENHEVREKALAVAEGKRMALGGEDDFGGLVDAEADTVRPVVPGWKEPSGDHPLDDEQQQHLDAVRARAAELRTADPTLDEREATRRARNDFLYAIVDDAPSRVTLATDGVHAAIQAADGPAILAALDGIGDLAERRQLLQDLRNRNDGAPLEDLVAHLPEDERIAVQARLNGIRANPEHVASAEALLVAQDEATRQFDHLIASGAPMAEIDAARSEVLRSRQAAVDAVMDAWGIDDSQVAQREPTALLGYGLMRGAIGPVMSGQAGDAVALPNGTVILPNSGERFLYDLVDGQKVLRSPALIAAGLGHEVEVHIEQLRDGRFTKNTLGMDVGTAINEVEAYGYMLREADRFGLDDTEKARIQTRLDDFLAVLDKADADARDRVARGDFSVGELPVETSERQPWSPHGGAAPVASDDGGKLMDLPPTETTTGLSAPIGPQTVAHDDQRWHFDGIDADGKVSLRPTSSVDVAVPKAAFGTMLGSEPVAGETVHLDGRAYTVVQTSLDGAVLRPLNHEDRVQVPLTDLGPIQTYIAGKDGVFTLEDRDGKLVAVPVDGGPPIHVEPKDVDPTFKTTNLEPLFNDGNKAHGLGEMDVHGSVQRQAHTLAGLLVVAPEGSEEHVPGEVLDPRRGIRSAVDVREVAIVESQALLSGLAERIEGSEGPLDLHWKRLRTEGDPTGEAHRVIEAMIVRAEAGDPVTVYFGNDGDHPLVDEMHPALLARLEAAERSGKLNIVRESEEDLAAPFNHVKTTVIGGEDPTVTVATGEIGNGKKIDGVITLGGEPAKLYAEYVGLLSSNDTSPRRSEVLEALAMHGLVVNDPVMGKYFAAQAHVGLLTDAVQVSMWVKQLLDPSTAERIVEQAKAGVKLDLTFREIDPASRKVLLEAIANDPTLPLTLRQLDSKWHGNATFGWNADGELQAYVGTNYLWTNQQNNLGTTSSYEDGVVLGGEHAESLLAQIKAHAKVSEKPLIPEDELSVGPKR